MNLKSNIGCFINGSEGGRGRVWRSQPWVGSSAGFAKPWLVDTITMTTLEHQQQSEREFWRDFELPEDKGQKEKNLNKDIEQSLGEFDRMLDLFDDPSDDMFASNADDYLVSDNHEDTLLALSRIAGNNHALWRTEDRNTVGSVTSVDSGKSLSNITTAETVHSITPLSTISSSSKNIALYKQNHNEDESYRGSITSKSSSCFLLPPANYLSTNHKKEADPLSQSDHSAPVNTHEDGYLNHDQLDSVSQSRMSVRSYLADEDSALEDHLVKDSDAAEEEYFDEPVTSGEGEAGYRMPLSGGNSLKHAANVPQHVRNSVVVEDAYMNNSEIEGRKNGSYRLDRKLQQAGGIAQMRQSTRSSIFAEEARLGAEGAHPPIGAQSAVPNGVGGDRQETTGLYDWISSVTAMNQSMLPAQKRDSDQPYGGGGGGGGTAEDRITMVFDDDGVVSEEVLHDSNHGDEVVEVEDSYANLDGVHSLPPPFEDTRGAAAEFSNYAGEVDYADDYDFSSIVRKKRVDEFLEPPSLFYESFSDFPPPPPPLLPSGYFDEPMSAEDIEPPGDFAHLAPPPAPPPPPDMPVPGKWKKSEVEEKKLTAALASEVVEFDRRDTMRSPLQAESLAAVPAIIDVIKLQGFKLRPTNAGEVIRSTGEIKGVVEGVTDNGDFEPRRISTLEPLSRAPPPPVNAKPAFEIGWSKTKKENSSSKTTDIDVSKLPGYQKIADDAPAWKKALIESKNKQLYEDSLSKLETMKMEEEKWKDVPVWKRNLLQEKEKKKIGNPVAPMFQEKTKPIQPPKKFM